MNKLKAIVAKSLLLSGLVLVVVSCSNDLEDAQLDADQTISSSEVKTILETDEFSSAADGVITDLFQQGESGKSAKNEDCFVADFSDTGFTVNFDNCSVEGSEEVLNGILTVTYEEGEESTAFTTTYADLSVGDVVINGTRNFTISSDSENENSSFTIISNMSIELADGSVIEEAGTKTFGVAFDFEDFSNSALTIDGNWTVTADGNSYVVNVTSTLVANFGCDYITEGVMAVTKNGLDVVVDFGDGSCDSVAEIIYPDGTVEEFSLNI